MPTRIAVCVLGGNPSSTFSITPYPKSRVRSDAGHPSPRRPDRGRRRSRGASVDAVKGGGTARAPKVTPTTDSTAADVRDLRNDVKQLLGAISAQPERTKWWVYITAAGSGLATATALGVGVWWFVSTSPAFLDLAKRMLLLDHKTVGRVPRLKRRVDQLEGRVETLEGWRPVTVSRRRTRH